MSTLTGLGNAYYKLGQGAVTALAANCKLWKPPFRAEVGDTPGSLIAQLNDCGPDNPHLTMRKTRDKFTSQLQAAEEPLIAADAQLQQYWAAGQWLKSGVPVASNVVVEVDEPLASYVRTLIDGGRAGLVDCQAIAKELLSLVKQGEEQLAAIRRSGRKYVSAGHIILVKSKAEYLAQFPAWELAVPGLLAKAERLTALHRQAYPTHRRSPVVRRGTKG